MSIIFEVLVTFLAEKTIGLGEQFLRKQHQRAQVENAFQQSWREAVSSYTFFSTLSQEDLRTFFASPRVAEELAKLISPSADDPDLKVLGKIWIERFGTPQQVPIQLIFERFISLLQQNLLALPEFSQVIQTKELRGLKRSVAALNRSQDLASRTLPASTFVSQGSASFEAIARRQISQIQVLMREGQWADALTLLESITRLTEQEIISPQLRAELYGLQADCLTNIGETTKNLGFYKRAYDLVPHSRYGLLQATKIAFYQGNIQEAHRLVKNALAYPAENDAVGVYRALKVIDLLTSYELKAYTSLDELIDPTLLGDIAYVRTLATVYLQSGNSERGTQYLKSARAISPDDIYTRFLWAQFYCNLCVLKPWQGVPLINAKPEEWHIAVVQAKTLLAEVFQQARKDRNTLLQEQVLLRQLELFFTLGDFAETSQATETLLDMKPFHPMGLFFLLITLISQGESSKIEALLNSIPFETQKVPPLAATVGDAYLYIHKPQQALEFINQVEPEIQFPEKIGLQWVRARAYQQLGNTEAIRTLYQHLERTKDEMAEVHKHLLLADISLCERNTAKRCRHLETAYGLATTDEQREIGFLLARYHSEVNDYERAVEWFEKAPFEAFPTQHDLEWYGSALYNTEQSEKLIALYEWMQTKGIISLPLLEMVGWTYKERLLNLAAALDVFNTLQSLVPHIHSYKLIVIRLHIRLRNLEIATNLITLLSPTDFPAPRDLLEVAHLFLVLKQDEMALRWALLSLRKGFEDPLVNHGYLIVYMHAEVQLRQLLQRDVAQANTAVHLRSSRGSERWLLLLDDLEPENVNELQITNPKAQPFLGKRPRDPVRRGGEEVRLKPITETVLEVQSLYTYYASNVMLHFEEHFQEEGLIQAFNILGEDRTLIRDLLRENQAHWESKYQHYTRGTLTLNQLAVLSGRQVCTLFFGLTSYAENPYITSLGSVDEQQAMLQSVTRADAITLHLTALLTLGQLKRLDLLTKHFKHLYVPQYLRDELIEELLQRHPHKDQAAKYLTLYGNTPYPVEVPLEQVQTEFQVLEEVLAFIAQSTEVTAFTPTTVTKWIPRVKAMNLNDTVLDTGSWLVAAQTATPLYVDDLMVRRIGATYFGLKGFSTHAFLQSSLEQGFLNMEEYTTLCGELMLRGYRFIPISADLILTTLKQVNYSPTHPLAISLGKTLNGDYSDVSAIDVGAITLYKLWQNPFLYERKVEIANWLLGNLEVQRGIDELYILLDHLLKALLLLNPIAWLELRNIVRKRYRLYRLLR